MTELAREDDLLMTAYSQGDLSAFETLYQRHKGPLYRYFVRQVSGRDVADDIYQECWTRIINAAPSYQPGAKWTTWAYRIAHNLVVDYYRRVKPVEAVGEIETGLHAPDRLHDQNELSRQLKHCMNKVPSVQLEVFILSMETDLTLKMISEVVSASHEAVKTRLRYAKTGLTACLKRFGLSSNTVKSEWQS